MKYGYRVPPYTETRNYVRTIGARYNQSTSLTPTVKTEQRPAKQSGGK